MILNCINVKQLRISQWYIKRHMNKHDMNLTGWRKLLEIIIVLYLMMFMKHSDGCSEHN